MNTAQLNGLLRHLLTTVGGGIGINGLDKDSNAQIAAGIVLTLLGAAMSYWTKREPAKDK